MNNTTQDAKTEEAKGEQLRTEGMTAEDEDEVMRILEVQDGLTEEDLKTVKAAVRGSIWLNNKTGRGLGRGGTARLSKAEIKRLAKWLIDSGADVTCVGDCNKVVRMLQGSCKVSTSNGVAHFKKAIV